MIKTLIIKYSIITLIPFVLALIVWCYLMNEWKTLNWRNPQKTLKKFMDEQNRFDELVDIARKNRQV